MGRVNIHQWAQKWAIPYAAVEDLQRAMGTRDDEATGGEGGSSEAAVQNRLRVEASRRGGILWRNNNGATMDNEGNFIRYGLANDSAQLNKRLKSSDLIGIRPVSIEPHHVGTIMGQFWAREVKPEGWRYSATPRELAQLRYIELVTALGGDAAFSTGEL